MHLAIAVGLGRDQVSQRRACRLLGQSRSTQRRVRQVPDGANNLVLPFLTTILPCEDAAECEEISVNACPRVYLRCLSVA